MTMSDLIMINPPLQTIRAIAHCPDARHEHLIDVRFLR